MDAQDHQTASAEAGPVAAPDVAPLKKATTGFLGSALALSTGTAIAQAISILVSPILS
jgi:transketolase N-terminal domain/subunit